MNLKGIMKSLGVKPGQVVSDPYVRAFAPQITEAEGNDHEVSMAKGSLEAIVKHANELMGKLGNDEKDIPGWIQDHIAKSENFIQQANDQYHEYGKNESVNEITIRKGLKFRQKISGELVDYEVINPNYYNAIKGGKTNLAKVINSTHSKIKVGSTQDFSSNDINSMIKSGIITKLVNESTFQNEVAGDTYVVYIMDGIGKKKVKETSGKTNAIRLVNRLMTNSKIEGAGWMSAEAWQKEPFRVS